MSMKKPKELIAIWIGLGLLLVGGLNWGLSLFDFNLVKFIFRIDFIVKVIYALVGLSAIYLTIRLPMMKIRE